jgi:general secretion pathway protein L
MSQLLITLPLKSSKQAEYAYAIVAASGVLSSQGFAAPGLMPKADQATLIVPSSALSWHAAKLPKLSRRHSTEKMQAMLAGVLEEQLLDEPAHLHLVPCAQLSVDGGGQDGGLTWVAAVDKAWLLQTVKALQEANIPLVRIIPQVFPTENVKLHAGGASEAAWLTYSDHQGVMNFPLSHSSLLPSLPDALNITAEPAIAAAAEQALGRRVHVMQAAQIALLAAQNAQEKELDFAQGDMAVAGRGRFWLNLMGGLGSVLSAPAWAPVRWGLALLLLANLIGLNAWSYQQTADLKNMRTQMNQLLTQTFPNVKVVVDAPLQMQREMANLRKAQGQLSERDFESIYGRFSSVTDISAAPDAIEYFANEVQIRGSAVAPAQLDALLPRLQYAGLQVKSEAQALIVTQRDAPEAVRAVKP